MASGIQWVVDLVLNKSSANKLQEEIEATLRLAGEGGGEKMLEALTTVFDMKIARARDALARGLIDQNTFSKIRETAEREFDQGVLMSIKQLGDQGKLTNDEFIKLTKSFKAIGDAGEGVEKKGSGALAKLGAAAKSLALSFAGLFAARKILAFTEESLHEYSEAEAIWNRLKGTLLGLGMSAEEASTRLEGIEVVAKRMQNTSPFDDEAVAAALTRMIDMTHNYQGSLNNLQLTADLAARKQIGLEEAGRLVGLAMTGNTQQFKRLGIILKEGIDPIEQMRKMFKGAAENEMLTFNGQTKMLHNAWADFKEEFGAALATMGGGKSVLQSIREVVVFLTNAIRQHSVELRIVGSAFAKFIGWLASEAMIAIEDAIKLWISFRLNLIAFAATVSKIGPVWKLFIAGLIDDAMPLVEFMNDIAAIFGKRLIDESAIKSVAARMRSESKAELARIGRQAEFEAEKVFKTLEAKRKSRAAGTTGDTGFDPADKGDRVQKEIDALGKLASAHELTQRDLVRIRTLEEQITAELEKKNIKEEKRLELRTKLAALVKMEGDAIVDLVGAANKPSRIATEKAVRSTMDKAKSIQQKMFEGRQQEQSARQVAFEKTNFPSLHNATDAWKREHKDMLAIAEGTFERISDAWQSAFDVMFQGTHDLGEAFGALAKGTAAALIGSVADVAKAHAKQEAISALEETAKAFGALALGDAPRAALAFKSAGIHAAAAVGWSALAGGGSAAASALGGGGRGDAGSRTAQNGQTIGPDIHLHLDGVDPKNARHQQRIGQANDQWRRRSGGGRIILEGA